MYLYHIEYILTSLDMFASIPENLLNYFSYNFSVFLKSRYRQIMFKSSFSFFPLAVAKPLKLLLARTHWQEPIPDSLPLCLSLSLHFRLIHLSRKRSIHWHSGWLNLVWNVSVFFVFQSKSLDPEFKLCL
jgi:hypothetical protein